MPHDTTAAMKSRDPSLPLIPLWHHAVRELSFGCWTNHQAQSISPINRSQVNPAYHRVCAKGFHLLIQFRLHSNAVSLESSALPDHLFELVIWHYDDTVFGRFAFSRSREIFWVYLGNVL